MLPDCADAGLEIGASAFIIRQWFINPGFTTIEKIIGPIVDYIQIGLSFFYIYGCISNNYTSLSTELVFLGKYLQAPVLTYFYVTSYLQGTRHDMFNVSFALLKQIFNVLDSTNYYFHIVDNIIALLALI